MLRHGLGCLGLLAGLPDGHEVGYCNIFLLKDFFVE